MQWYRNRYESGNDGWWKAFGITGVLFGMLMTVVSLCLREKNKKYRDALITMSEQLPEEDDAKARRAAWRSFHAPANRITVEKRLENQRVEEEA